MPLEAKQEESKHNSEEFLFVSITLKMQVSCTSEDSMEDMFYYVMFGLLQIEKEGSFKKSRISYMHMHKHDKFGFNGKTKAIHSKSQTRTFSILSHIPVYQ